MDSLFYLSLESCIEGQKDKPLVDVIGGFLEDCAARHLADSKGWGRAGEKNMVADERELFVKDFRRRMSRWQQAVRAYFERVVVNADPVEKGVGSHGRSVGDIEKALGWLDSDGDSFADVLVSNSIVKFEEPPC